MDVLAAGEASVVAVRVAAAGAALSCGPETDAFAGCLEAAELLDVDVDKFARPLPLVAHSRPEADPAGLPIPLRLSTAGTVEGRHRQRL